MCSLLCASICAYAQDLTEKSYSVYFRAGDADIDLSYLDNVDVVETMIHDVRESLHHENFMPDTIRIYASSSPEGPHQTNSVLAHKRGEAAKNLILNALPELAGISFTIESKPEDWSGIIHTLSNDTTIPHRDTILSVLTDSTVIYKTTALREMSTEYAFINENLLSNLRTATIVINLIETPEENTVGTIETVAEKTVEETVEETADEAVELKVAYTGPESEERPFYMAIKNNMIYDIAAIPNIGAEFYLGGNLSLAGNWMYSWWKNDAKTWYWRTYGGDLALRYWFGKASQKKPLQGHHVGLYGQMITYDFELGNKGILADRWSWSAGLEYGYSVPVARRLNIDFTLGAGYHKGQFYEYLPIDGHYVWQATKNRVFMGPTKLEISLVWLLGRSNENERKGGK